jgi:dienelactone hydrolase
LIRFERRLHPEGASGPSLTVKAMTDRNHKRIAGHFQTKLPAMTGGFSGDHRYETYWSCRTCHRRTGPSLIEHARTPRQAAESDIRGLIRVASVAELLLFHHAHGQTDGFVAFADELRAAGHLVHAPDLYDGKTFAELADGVAYAKEVGFDVIIERGAAAAEELPAEIVYAGFSLGVLPAQMLAQTRPGARGALLLNACVPTSEFDSPWPAGVPVQIHAMDADEWFEEDAAAAQELVDEAESAELFLYPGDGHLFADSSLSDFDEEAAALLKKRILVFLEGVG